MKGSKVTKVIISLLISSVLILMTGCQSEPIISKEEITSIKADLGYVIAPTWLPEGFESMDLYEHMDENMTIRSFGELSYSDSQVVVFLRYPADTPMSLGGSNPLFEALNLDWQAPEDAVEMVRVKSRDAYFIQGIWSTEVLKALNRLDEEKLHSMAPEWDYDFAKTVYFEFELSSKEVVNVSLAVMYRAELISREELIRIAESCVQVE
jgi:hypothetical protein